MHENLNNIFMKGCLVVVIKVFQVILKTMNGGTINVVNIIKILLIEEKKN